MLIGAVFRRDSPYDVAVFHPKHKGSTLASLPEGSVIGTSSLRRSAQLKRAFPHLIIEDVRGNLNTRLNKLDAGDKYDALILAAAGMERMGWAERIEQVRDGLLFSRYLVLTTSLTCNYEILYKNVESDILRKTSQNYQ